MSNSRSYNLLDKPWIPVIWRVNEMNPQEPKIGIREALKRAHEINRISHTAPFIEFGLYRLLITIVLDAYIVHKKRPTISKMKTMLNEGIFDWGVVGKYLDESKDLFDLWAEQYPFLQRDGSNDQKKPVVSMFAAIPSGTNVAHWHHYVENEMSIDEDVAAQFLTAVSPWNFKTKPGEARTLAGDPPMYALVLGGSLFETIVLNLPRPSGRTIVKEEVDNGPAWRTKLELTNLPKSPTMTQGYTWPVRIIRLHNDGSMIAQAINQAAYKKPTEKAIKANKKKATEDKDVLFEATNGWRDPNAGTIAGKDVMDHIKGRPGIPIWRDAVPMFLVSSEGESLRGDKRRSRPEVITNALRVLERPQFQVTVYGMRKKGGGGGDVKVEEWFRSVLTLPTEVARDSRLSTRAFDAFKTTQKVADALQIGLRMLRAPSEVKKTARKNIHREESNALAVFWHSLEPVLSHSYLDALADNALKAEEYLWSTVRRQARETFSVAAGPHRRTAAGLFRIANANNWFERRLSWFLPKPIQEKKS